MALDTPRTDDTVAPVNAPPGLTGIHEMARMYLLRLIGEAENERGWNGRVLDHGGRPVSARLWDPATAGRSLTVGCEVELVGQEASPSLRGWFTDEGRRVVSVEYTTAMLNVIEIRWHRNAGE